MVRQVQTPGAADLLHPLGDLLDLLRGRNLFEAETRIAAFHLDTVKILAFGKTILQLYVRKGAKESPFEPFPVGLFHHVDIGENPFAVIVPDTGAAQGQFQIAFGHKGILMVIFFAWEGRNFLVEIGLAG